MKPDNQDTANARPASTRSVRRGPPGRMHTPAPRPLVPAGRAGQGREAFVEAGIARARASLQKALADIDRPRHSLRRALDDLNRAQRGCGCLLPDIVLGYRVKPCHRLHGHDGEHEGQTAHFKQIVRWR